jgi:hypothetical protein
MRLLCPTIVILAAFLSYGTAAAGGASTDVQGGISGAGLAIAIAYLFLARNFCDEGGN